MKRSDFSNHCLSKVKVQVSPLRVLRVKAREALEKQVTQESQLARVLTHSGHRAQLPKDPSRPLLRCLSEQKQVFGLHGRSTHRVWKGKSGTF